MNAEMSSKKRGRPRLSEDEKAKRAAEKAQKAEEKAKAKTKAKKDKRYLNWTFVTYPDSAPSNWRDILNDMHIPYAISPLHDKDISGDGLPKKPHYHVILAFETVKSYSQIKEITDQINAPIPQAVNSLVGTTRYLTHMDDPNKAQYDKEDIVTGGNFPLSDLLARSATDKKAIVKEIYQFIQDNDITEYHDIVDYAFANNEDWFDVLINGYTLFFVNILKSRRHDIKLQEERNIKSKVDKNTGEVID